MRSLNIGMEQALQKIKQYCAYQERTHHETKEKLYSYGLYQHEVEQLLTQMIEENYLNEERFAIAYAGGKFRMNHWGRVKIRYEMKQKQLSEYCIQKGLASIDEEDYLATLQKLADNKLLQLKAEKNIFTRRRKLQQYLAQKGYESFMIAEVISKI